MKKKTLILLCTIAPFFVACNGKASDSNQNEQTQNTSITESENKTEEDIEGEVMDLVLAIPEVVEIGKQIEKTTNGKHGVAAMVSLDEDGRYCVSVGLNGEDRFETMQIFYVDKMTREISALHIISAKEYPLKEWQDRYKKYQAGDESAFPNDDE